MVLRDYVVHFALMVDSIEYSRAFSVTLVSRVFRGRGAMLPFQPTLILWWRFLTIQ